MRVVVTPSVNPLPATRRFNLSEVAITKQSNSGCATVDPAAVILCGEASHQSLSDNAIIVPVTGELPPHDVGFSASVIRTNVLS